MATKMALISRTFFRGYPFVVSRSFHVSQTMNDDTAKKFYFNLRGFNQYGLLEDDLLRNIDPDIIEAIRRLPEEEQMQRKYRAIRALQAEINHTILPKEQWTKFEDNHNYLKPYIEEIKKEKEEMDEWEATH